MLFRCSVLIFDLSSTVWPLESNNSKNNRFTKTFFCNHFWLNYAWHWFYQHSFPVVETRRMSYNLTLKSHVENLTKGQGHDLIGNVMLHISRFVASAWIHLWCFHRSSLSISKVIAEKLLATFDDLKWPRKYEGSQAVNFRFRVSIIPVNRWLRMLKIVFVQ